LVLFPNIDHVVSCFIFKTFACCCIIWACCFCCDIRDTPRVSYYLLLPLITEFIYQNV